MVLEEAPRVTRPIPEARAAYLMLLVRLKDYTKAVTQADILVRDDPTAPVGLLRRPSRRTIVSARSPFLCFSV